MASMYLVERTELEALDPQFLGSLARDGIAIKGTGLDPSLPQVRAEPCQPVTQHLARLRHEEKVAPSREP